MKNLKRIFVVAIAIIATVASANAQFKWGIKAGMNINKVHFSDNALKNTFNSGNSTGWTAGVMAEFTIPVIGVAIDAGVMYARMNNGCDDKITELEDNGSAVSEGNVLGRNFLEIPVNLKYKFTIPVVASIVKPYLFTGPNFSFKLDKNVLSDIKTHTCEVAWNVGLGVELVNHVQIGAGYAFGMTNTFSKISGWENMTEIKAKNNYWTITAAYLF